VSARPRRRARPAGRLPDRRGRRGHRRRGHGRDPRGPGDYLAWALAPRPLASIVGGLSRPILVALRREGGPRRSPQAGPLRAGLAVLALAYLADAIALLADPTAFPAPFDMPRWAAASSASGASSWPSWPPGPPCGAAARPASPSSPWSPSPPASCSRPRSYSDMEAGSPRTAWVVVLAILTAIGAAAYAVARPAREPRPRSAPPRTSSRRADRRDAGTATWPLPGWPLGWR
jgi:hypothetical protein